MTGYGVWTTAEGEIELIDSTGKKMLIEDVKALSRHKLAKKEPEELMAMLIDRLDIEDLANLVLDSEFKFLE